jgi:hypothetical protein
MAVKTISLRAILTIFWPYEKERLAFLEMCW